VLKYGRKIAGEKAEPRLHLRKDSAMPLQSATCFTPHRDHPKLSAIGCENGRHSAASGSKIEINGVVHATCRHCGCELMRLGASRRWFRTGEMGG